MTIEENHNTFFEKILAELANEEQPFSPKHLHAFSDLDSAALEQLKQVWPHLSMQRKINLLEDLEELMEADTLISCDALAKFAMQDTEASVRSQAINLLWECEEISLIPLLLDMLENDPAELVRASAAAALGKFILLGELDEIPKEKSVPVIAKLLEISQQRPAGMIQRKALESLGYFSDECVATLIAQALQKNDVEWLASALFAMGRSLDERWSPLILEHINHPDLTVQIEAIRAAGELELAAANEKFFSILDKENVDSEVRSQIYWALSKIGGKGVRERLEQEQEETDDEDLLDVLEMALENLDFTEDSNSFDLFNLE